MFKDRLRYCYIDMSTAKSHGSTSIRIFPPKKHGHFFNSDARNIIASRKYDIEDIIREAQEVNDKVRIIVSRESDFDKSLRKYVDSNKAKKTIYEEILKKASDLVTEIKFYDIRQSTELLSAIGKSNLKYPTHKLDTDLKNFLEKDYDVKFDSNRRKLNVFNVGGYNFHLHEEIWQDVDWKNA